MSIWAYKLRPKSAEGLVMHGDDVIGAASPSGNVSYFAFEMPLYADCLENILQQTGQTVDIKGPCEFFHQTYNLPDGKRAYVLIPSRKSRFLEGKFAIRGRTIQLTSCRVAVLILSKEQDLEARCF